MFSSKAFMSLKTRKIDLNKNFDKIIEDKIAIESPVRLFLNKKLLTTMMASPIDLKELAVGFIVDEGIVPKYKEIIDVKINENEIHIHSNKVNEERRKRIEEQNVILTSCASKADFYHVIDDLNKNPLKNSHQIDAKEIIQMVIESIKKSAVFKLTGGVHWASIFIDKRIRGFGEDVGRHNAVDKAIGNCLDENGTLENAILVTSGRQTGDVVMKAARCRIPISVSMRAPLSTGIYAAELIGITLVCFARGNRMNIYSNYDRVRPLGI